MPESNADGFSELARAGRRTRSTALLRAATELYVLERDHDRDQNRRFEELMVHLLPEAGLVDRMFVAEQLADAGDAPSAVLRLLAGDRIDVARPVLQRSRALRTFDLLTVIAGTGEEHHRLIAARPDLDHQVRKALVLSLGADAAGVAEGGDEGDTAPLTVVDLAAEATDSPTRPVPYTASDFLGARRGARLRCLADIASTPPAVDGTASQAPARALDAMARTAAIIGFARDGKADETITAIAAGLKLPAALVAASIKDPTGEPLAVLLKAMRLDDATAQQVFLLMSPVGDDVGRFFALADLFSAMETYVADTLVARWRGADQTARRTVGPHEAEPRHRRSA